MNWNSKTGDWSEVIKPETRNKKEIARRLKRESVSVKEIASILNLSEGRIYEYLRE